MAYVEFKRINEIESKLGIQPSGPVQKFVTETCYKKMDKYVPKNIGNLRTVVRLEADSITYESPYAHAQYKGIVNGSKVRRYTTPGTGPRWDERMKTAEINQIVKEVEKYMGGK